MKNPCLNCPDRWVRDGKSCHGNCEREAEYKAHVNGIKEAVRASNAYENRMIGYKLTQMREAKRRKRK